MKPLGPRTPKRRKTTKKSFPKQRPPRRKKPKPGGSKWTRGRTGKRT